MLEAANADLFTISLKRSIQNLQLSTSRPADYPILWQILLKNSSSKHFRYVAENAISRPSLS